LFNHASKCTKSEEELSYDNVICNSLVNVLLHVRVTVVRPFELPVEDHVFSRRETSDEHIVLRTHSYLGLAILLSVQANFAARRCHHSGQHLAAMRNFMNALRVIDGKYIIKLSNGLKARLTIQ